jgi:perosamine synthetase
MIPLSTPDLRGRELDYLRRCVEDNWVSSAGPFVTEIEQRVALLCDVPYAVATVNGTTALQLALLASGIRPGDAVVIPDWTFAATANAVIHSGAEPVFADVSEVNLTLSPRWVEEAFRVSTKAIRAVVAVHTLGRAPDLESLARLCRRHNAALIEDAAGAFGAAACNRPAGSFGDAGIFSFNGNKIATAGGGGMIITRNEKLARRARHLSQQARIGEEYSHDEAGFNFRMTNLNAAVGLAQLERLDEMKARRLEIQQRYDAALFPSNRLAPLPRAPWDQPYCWLYSVRCHDADAAATLVDTLRQARIEGRRFWRSLSGQPPYARFACFGGGVASSLSSVVVSLPCSSHLTEVDQDVVIAAVKRWEHTAN